LVASPRAQISYGPPELVARNNGVAARSGSLFVFQFNWRNRVGDGSHSVGARDDELDGCACGNQPPLAG